MSEQNKNNLIILGLGSSHKHALRWLRRAVRELKGHPQIQLVSVSNIYDSQAQLPENAPSSWQVPYLNLVVACRFFSKDDDPHELLEILKEMEKSLGRKKREQWAPREIDIDILIYKDKGVQSPALTIPHPWLLERPFALWPLLELYPKWVHPEKTEFQKSQLQKWKEVGPPFQTRQTLLSLTELVGILNLTPDSFSDGGRLNNLDEILGKIHDHIAHGATVLDFGAESTRPGASKITEEEEWIRLRSGFQALKLLSPERRAQIQISIDCKNPKVLARILETESIDWVNDVTGGSDSELLNLVQKSKAQYVFMHSLSVPPTQELVIAPSKSPVEELMMWAQNRLEIFEKHGLQKNRLIFDPGVGFGKNFQQNSEILKCVRDFHSLKIPLLLGHSRKSFLTQWTSKPAADRDLETAVVSAQLEQNGVEYLRVHDVSSQASALKVVVSLQKGGVLFS